jgi:hypothetical protein
MDLIANTPSNKAVDEYVEGMRYGKMLRALADYHHVLDDIELIADPETRLRLYVEIATSPIPEQLAAIRKRAKRELQKALKQK